VSARSRGSPSGLCLGVAGSGEPDLGTAAVAQEVGHRLGSAGASLVCGGLGGVMEAACRGAREAGGQTLAILPGGDRRQANPFVDVAVATGMGEARNALIVCTADALIAVGGEFGTLSEIALALKAGKPVVGIGTWELEKASRPVEGIVAAFSAEEAVERALALAAAATRL
jgi:uncharacterized protein (TIGR00725 family)